MIRIANIVTGLLVLLVAIPSQGVSDKATSEESRQLQPNEPKPASGISDSTEASRLDTIETASGLRYVELRKGKGRLASAGAQVFVQYTGRFHDGRIFDSSHNKGRPFHFKLGSGQVIKGWDEGIPGMQVGGKRLLIIPPQLAYGDKGFGKIIPPGTTLYFEVELVEVR